MNWISIESLNDFKEALQNSNEVPVLIFKHRTRCPVSFISKKKIQAEWSYDENDIKASFLHLTKNRDISGHIAQVSNIRYESPQASVFK